MSKTLRSLLVAAFLLYFGFANAQTPATSISIDYTYEGISADDPLGQMMFAGKHFQVYADADYISLKVFSNPDKPNTMDGIITEIVRRRSDNQTFIYMTIGSEKLKIEGTESEQSAATERLFGSFVDTSFSLVNTGTSIEISGQNCQKILLKHIDPDMVAPTIYLSNATPSELVRLLPSFVKRESGAEGLCLGTDMPYGEHTYKLRAVEIKNDMKVDLAAHVAEFRKADKAEINKTIKAYIGM